MGKTKITFVYFTKFGSQDTFLNIRTEKHLFYMHTDDFKNWGMLISHAEDMFHEHQRYPLGKVYFPLFRFEE